MRLNNNKGFTLIEVVVAFAVLAIVSGSLLQMFVTSTKVNQRSYSKDKANILAVKLLEEFKATPEDADVALFHELSGATRTVSGSAIIYSKYLGLDWSSSDAASYAYMLEVQTTDTVPLDNGEMSFYTDPVYSVEFNPLSGGNFTLEAWNPVNAAHPDGDQTQLLFQFYPNVITTSAIEYGNVKDGKVAVLVKANPPVITSTAITVNIKNKAKLTMAADGSYLSTGTPGEFELAVYFMGIPETLATLDRISGGFEGLSSYSFIDASAVSTHFKTMQVKVTSRADGTVIADQQAGKYVVEKQ